MAIKLKSKSKPRPRAYVVCASGGRSQQGDDVNRVVWLLLHDRSAAMPSEAVNVKRGRPPHDPIKLAEAYDRYLDDPTTNQASHPTTEPAWQKTQEIIAGSAVAAPKLT